MVVCGSGGTAPTAAEIEEAAGKPSGLGECGDPAGDIV